MTSELRYVVLGLGTVLAGVGVFRTFRKALRERNGEHYELGSGRIFDAFTTDWGFPLFLACLALSIADAALGGPRLSPALQQLGTAAYLLACGLLVWADAHLARHFSDYSADEPKLMTTGPYRLVRHPRYASWIGLLVSFALALGSPWGLLASLPFTVMVWRRVRLEDVFLQQLYGERYRVYAAGTARLVPGLW